MPTQKAKASRFKGRSTHSSLGQANAEICNILSQGKSQKS